MHINEISEIVGSRPAYNDKCANGRRARRWYNVDAHKFVRVAQFVASVGANADYSGNSVRVGIELKWNGTTLTVIMKDGAKQKNIDAQLRGMGRL